MGVYLRDDPAYARAERREDAHDAAVARLRQLGRYGLWPQAVDALVAAFGYTVRPWPVHAVNADGRHALVVPDVREIWVVATDPPPVQRLSVGHKLGHVKLGPDTTEDECNAFGGALLLPQAVAGEALAGYAPMTPRQWADGEWDHGLVSTLAARSGLGWRAVWVALGDYGWILGVPRWLGPRGLGGAWTAFMNRLAVREAQKWGTAGRRSPGSGRVPASPWQRSRK